MNPSQINLFVTGIGTDVGKTICSAILVEALKADYWKPIQAGDLQQSDTMTVASLVSANHSKFHPEAYRLKSAMSPHAAAAIDGIKIELKSLTLPKTENSLIIEGPGGLFVPLNSTELVIDMITRFDLSVVVVSKNYLGSINHSLLTISALQSRNVKIQGIVFNGETATSSEDFILKFTGVPCIGRIFSEPQINPAVIKRYALEFREHIMPTGGRPNNEWRISSTKTVKPEAFQESRKLRPSEES